MATSQAGPAPVTARIIVDCPAFIEGERNSGCGPCRRGNYNNCRFPLRQGKTKRDKRNLRVRVKNIKDWV